MYSNDRNFTKDPFEDNGRFKIHPLSKEGFEAYMSKDSYNHNFIKTKKNPELLKEIEEEIKAENELKQKLEKASLDNANTINNNQENLKNDENNGEKKDNTMVSKGENNLKNKKIKTNNKNCCNSLKKYNKISVNKRNKIKEKKSRQSPGIRLANSIANSGKVSGPVIRNVENDRGKLWEYPTPYNH